MNRRSDSLTSRGAIALALYAPAVALLFYFLGGILPFALQVFGIDADTGFLHGIYSHVCHQIPDRSFAINSVQMGFCSRCTGLYGALALVSLCVAITGKTKPIRWIWLLLLCLPIILDVVFDLSVSSSLNNYSRLATGALGGIGIALFVYPRLVAAVRYSLAPEHDAL